CGLHPLLRPPRPLFPSLLILSPLPLCSLYFFHDPATTQISPLSLHYALPILLEAGLRVGSDGGAHQGDAELRAVEHRLLDDAVRSEEHTSELQSLTNLVCRLLLERKKKRKTPLHTPHTSSPTTFTSPLHYSHH